MSLKAEIKKTRANVFRRLYLKRKQRNGFETAWQLVPEKYIKGWGSNTYSVNDVKVNFFEMSGQNIQLLNIDNYFSEEGANNSFFFGALTRYGTLCKIEAGYTADDGTEYPTDPTIFTGYLKQSLKQSNDATLTFAFKPMAAAFQEYKCRDITMTVLNTTTVDGEGVTTTTYFSRYTASEFIGLIENFVAGSITVYNDYITDWQYTNPTTEEYIVSTATIGDMSHWDLLTKLAIAENSTTFVDRTGVFYFIPRAYGFDTTDYPTLNGIGAASKEWGHTIKELQSVYDNIDNVYNSVKIKFDEADTTTSYYTRSEDWQYGDFSSVNRFGSRQLEIDNQWVTEARAQVIADELYAELRDPVKTVELDMSFLPGLELLMLSNVDFKTPRVGDVGSPLWGAFLWSAATWGSGGTRYITIDREQYRIRSITQDLDNFSTSIRGTLAAPYFFGGYNSSYYNRNLYGE